MANDTAKPDPEDEALLKAVEETGPVALQEPSRPDQPTPDAADASVAGPAEAAVPLRKVTTAPAPRRSGATGGFAAMLLGGAVCLAAGYGAARYLPPGLIPLPPSAETQDMQARLDALAQELAQTRAALAERPAADPELAQRLAALEQAPTPDAGLADRLSTVEEQLSTLEAGSGATDPALTAEVAALKSQIDGLQTGTPPQVEEALAEVQSRIDAAAQEAASVAETAQAAARKVLAQAAMGRLLAALDTGLPYGSALADLGVDVPPVLAEAAETGLPTLATLRDGFPDAARAGMEAALHADMGAGWTERAANFLRAQTGARSLTPREGTDPDAILSRAEAALATGDTAAAVAEVKSLPEPAQQAMAGWIALADRRLAAETAVADLSRQIGAL